MTCTPKPFNGMMMMMLRIQIIQMTMTRKKWGGSVVFINSSFFTPSYSVTSLSLSFESVCKWKSRQGWREEEPFKTDPQADKECERERLVSDIFHFFLCKEKGAQGNFEWTHAFQWNAPTKDCPLHCIISFEKRTPVKPVESTLFFEREDRRK